MNPNCRIDSLEYFIENRAPTDSEFEEIYDLMNRVWHKVWYKKGTYFFNREVLEWYARNPNQKSDFFWIAFEKNSNKVIGFALIFPRYMKIDGKGPYLFAYGSLITVDLEYQKFGIAKAIAKQVPEVYAKYNIIGVFIMFEEGSKGPGSLRKDRLKKMKELWTRNYVYTRPLNVNGLGSYLGMRLHEKMFARFLQGVKPTENKKIRSFREGDEAGIQQLLNSYSKELSLARYWDLEELQSYLRYPLIRGKVYYVEGEIRAFVCAVVLPYFARGKRLKIAIFENCHYENIPLLDQKRLVQSMLYDLKREGVVIAVDMAVGYNDSLPLRKNRFFKHPRKMSVGVIPNISDQDERLSDMMKSATVYLDSR